MLMDGFISGVAALCAVRLCPAAGAVCQPLLHQTKRQAGAGSAGQNYCSPPGSILARAPGAVASIPLWDMALAVSRLLIRFTEGGITPYTPMLTLVLSGAASGKSGYAEPGAENRASALLHRHHAGVGCRSVPPGEKKLFRKMRAAKQFETVGVPVYYKSGKMIGLQTIAVAFAMFSALPVPQFAWNQKKHAVCHVCPAHRVAGWRAVVPSGALPSPMPAKAACGFCLILVWVMGGIHLAGYADTCDVSSYGDREAVCWLILPLRTAWSGEEHRPRPHLCFSGNSKDAISQRSCSAGSPLRRATVLGGWGWRWRRFLSLVRYYVAPKKAVWRHHRRSGRVVLQKKPSCGCWRRCACQWGGLL